LVDERSIRPVKGEFPCPVLERQRSLDLDELEMSPRLRRARARTAIVKRQELSRTSGMTRCGDQDKIGERKLMRCWRKGLRLLRRRAEQNVVWQKSILVELQSARPILHLPELTFPLPCPTLRDILRRDLECRAAGMAPRVSFSAAWHLARPQQRQALQPWPWLCPAVRDSISG
jgi:hypothetical protein